MFVLPSCKYCHQTSTKYEEALYTVCMCNDIAKFAHGSCFNQWLKKFVYGECEVCGAKTKIVANGLKNICKWRFRKPTRFIGVYMISVFLFAIILIAYVVWWLTSSRYPPVFSIVVFVILLLLLLISLLLCACLKPTKLFCYKLYMDNRSWKIVRYENGCSGVEPPYADITEITQAIGQLREMNQGGRGGGGGVGETQQHTVGSRLQASESIRSQEELRNSGMMDENFYLQSTDASSSIRDRNDEVIGQWI